MLQRNPLCQDPITPDLNSQIMAARDTLSRVNAVLLHLIDQCSNDDEHWARALILETVLNATTYAGRLLKKPEAIAAHEARLGGEL